MSKEGTITANLESIAWVKIDGRDCWAVKLFLWRDNEYYISYPSRYYKESSKHYIPGPVLVIILEKYKRAPRKGLYKDPNVYELSYHVMSTKKEQVRYKDPITGKFRGGIQGSRLDGYFIPMRELYLYRTRTQEEAEKENSEAIAIEIKVKEKRFKKNT